MTSDAKIKHYNRLVSCSSDGSRSSGQTATISDETLISDPQERLAMKYDSAKGDSEAKCDSVTASEYSKQHDAIHIEYDDGDYKVNKAVDETSKERSLTSSGVYMYRQWNHGCSNNKQNKHDDKLKETLESRHSNVRFLFNEQELDDLKEIVVKKWDKKYKQAILDLKVKHTRIQRLFLSLAGLSLILIVCVVAVLPVTLISVKTAEIPDSKIKDAVQYELNSGDLKYLADSEMRSSETIRIVKHVVLCVVCTSVPEVLKTIFREKAFTRECCVDDIQTLLQKLTNDHIQGYKTLDQKINELSLFILPNDTSESHYIIQIHNGIHSRMDRLEGMLVELLNRRRSAIHLESDGFENYKGHGPPRWSIGIAENMKVAHHRNIQIFDGGLYFVYCTLRFKTGGCKLGGVFGYQIKESAQHRSIATVVHECVDNAISLDQDLAVQKVHFFDKKENIDLSIYIEMDSMSEALLHYGYRHYFGVFQI